MVLQLVRAGFLTKRLVAQGSGESVPMRQFSGLVSVYRAAHPSRLLHGVSRGGGTVGRWDVSG